MKQEMLKKSDQLIRFRMTLTREEQDIVSLVADRLRQYEDENFYLEKQGKPKKNPPTEFKFSAKELLEDFGRSRQALYSYLDKGTDGAMTRIFSIKDPKTANLKS